MSEPGDRVIPMTPAQLLDFEAQWPRHTGRKETALIELGVAPARYYVELLRAATSLEGQQHDPITAHRVLRMARTAA